MQFKIYLVMNRTNFKKYVGLTSRTVARRFYEHSINRKSAIGLAIQKYGRDNFLVVVIETCETLEKANEREKYWIAFHDCIAPSGYNRTDGGECAIPSEETRERQSEAANKRFENPQEREKISETLTGRKDSEEVKARKRAAQKKRYAENPMESQKQSEGLKKRFSNPDEHKKHSEIMKKYKAEHPVTDETKRAISVKKEKYKKKVRCIETGEIFESISIAAKNFNTEPTQISRVCRGVRQTYHGYHFEFVKD